MRVLLWSGLQHGTSSSCLALDPQVKTSHDAAAVDTRDGSEEHQIDMLAADARCPINLSTKISGESDFSTATDKHD